MNETSSTNISTENPNIVNTAPNNGTIANNVSPSNAGPSTGGAADISKTTIAVLVLLTLMISIIGTWTVLSEISNYRGSQAAPRPSAGQVHLNIQPPSDSQLQSTTGQVVLNIAKPQ